VRHVVRRQVRIDVSQGVQRLQSREHRGGGRGEADGVELVDLALGEHVGMVGHIALGLVVRGRRHRVDQPLLHHLSQDGVGRTSLLDGELRRLVELLLAGHVGDDRACDDRLQGALLERLVGLGIGRVHPGHLGLQVQLRDLMAVDVGHDLALRRLRAHARDAAAAEAQRGHARHADHNEILHEFPSSPPAHSARPLAQPWTSAPERSSLPPARPSQNAAHTQANLMIVAKRLS